MRDRQRMWLFIVLSSTAHLVVLASILPQSPPDREKENWAIKAVHRKAVASQPSHLSDRGGIVVWIPDPIPPPVPERIDAPLQGSPPSPIPRRGQLVQPPALPKPVPLADRPVVVPTDDEETSTTQRPIYVTAPRSVAVSPIEDEEGRGRGQAAAPVLAETSVVEESEPLDAMPDANELEVQRPSQPIPRDVSPIDDEKPDLLNGPPLPTMDIPEGAGEKNADVDRIEGVEDPTIPNPQRLPQSPQAQGVGTLRDGADFGPEEGKEREEIPSPKERTPEEVPAPQSTDNNQGDTATDGTSSQVSSEDQESGETARRDRGDQEGSEAPESLLSLPPRVERMTPPQYPRRARRLGVEGVAELEVFVNEDGIPTDARVIRSSGRMDMDAAAEEAVLQWRFSPAQNGEQRVSASVEVTIEFRLRD